VSLGLRSFVGPHPGNRWQHCRGTAGGYYRCSGTGGPSTCHSAHSTRRKDKDLLSGGRAKALLAGRPPLPYSEERKPTCGKKTKIAVVWAIDSPDHGIPLSQEVGESQWRTTLGRGTNSMAKARVAPTTALLEDVMRGPRPASSEALPCWHLFDLNHFLEGVQGRCL
jgi:hypothetical protein